MTQRQEIIERLNGLEMEGGSHAMLSAICKAVLPHGDAWTLRRCADLRDRLVRLLGEVDAAHSDGGSITDELRHSIENAEQFYGREFPCLTAIADRIDAEHERLMQEQPFTIDMVPMTDERMAEHGFVRLHKDADGEYIHEHDKVDWRDHAGTWHKNALVVAVCSDGCYVMDGMVFHVHASDIRHYKQSTVEDVLLDCIANVCRANHQLFEQGCYLTMHDVECETDEYIAEYAAKLRLAGDAE